MSGFIRPERKAKGKGGEPRPQTFNFLGFTHYWERTRWRTWVVRRRTISKRLSRTLQTVGQWCKRVRHWPIRQQWEGLRRKLQGYYQYYGVTGNDPALRKVYQGVIRRWRKWLDRRGAKERVSWQKMEQLLKWLPLPKPRVVNSIYRLAAKP